MLGIYRAVVPPDPISNSEVKRSIADDSVGFPHVKVGQCQALTSKASSKVRLLFPRSINKVVFLANKKEFLKNVLTVFNMLFRIRASLHWVGV